MSSPILSVRRVSRRFAGLQAVAEADLELHAGRISCLLGPSGCGKSTLLRMIAGLEPIDSGEIAIGGMPMSTGRTTVLPEDRGVGLVFQDFALFPHLDVTQNVAFGLTAMDPAARQARVAALLPRFRLDTLAHAWPHTLSGGEQQRVAIARALAREPAVLLLDEPFSGLDGHLRAAVRQSLLADLRAAGTAVLIVTHDPEEAMLAADDLVLMAAGRILQTGSPEDCYLRPVSVEAARLLGEAAILPGRIESGMALTAFGAVPVPGMPDGPASVMVRPEGFRVGAAGGQADIVGIGFAGAFHVLTLAADDIVVTARTADTPPAVGTRIGIGIDPSRASVFGPPP